MQQQYNQIKSAYPEHIILFRLGDFYESFNNDAHICASVLGITLTGRGKDANRQDMAGIPYHALDNYLPKLLSAGYKIAIVEQTSSPSVGKLVNREVVRVYTPGTLISDTTLSDNQHNFLAAVYHSKETKLWSLACGDTSTNQVWLGEYSLLQDLHNYLKSYSVAEVIYCQLDYVGMPDLPSTNLPAANFDTKHIYSFLKQSLHIESLAGYGVTNGSGIYNCLSGYLNYYNDCYKTPITYLKFSKVSSFNLDLATIKNLEILNNTFNASATLYNCVNQCFTPGGKRLLRMWLVQLLQTEKEIMRRQNLVSFLFGQPILLTECQDLLKHIGDIERLAGKLTAGIAGPKDLVYLVSSVNNAIELTLKFNNQPNWQLNPSIVKSLGEFTSLISQNILPTPSASINEGYIFNLGINSQIDNLRNLSSGGKSELANLQASEAASTGITNLKVGYNNVFGYFLEVTNSHKSKVPDYYTRKQTMTGAERYTTPQLKELESKILTAQFELVALEKELYLDFAKQLLVYIKDLLDLAELVSSLDILCGWASIARQRVWAAPQFCETNEIIVQEGVHPVVSQFVSQFTPNSTNLELSTSTMIITGPNMAGKSTYIRQVAILTLLAQVGSFVPAKSMQLKPVDQIFTRIGASDNLSAGSSTFMLEMYESANILNNATINSLVILDEVGRGTSTYDGLSIAWSMVEYLTNTIKCKTLFATHYHELIDLADKNAQIKNYHVHGVEQEDKIIFTHQLKPGGASKSYGIQVAKLAGVPATVIDRSKELLAQFTNPTNTLPKPLQNQGKQAGEQLSLL